MIKRVVIALLIMLHCLLYKLCFFSVPYNHLPSVLTLCQAGFRQWVPTKSPLTYATGYN